jgi:hypothetical protein
MTCYFCTFVFVPDFLQAVLPGPEEATPPVERKFTAILQKHTAFLLYNAFNCTLTFENYDEIVFYFNSFCLVSCTKCLKTKFRYFSATFSSHSGTVKNFYAAPDQAAPAPAPTLL